MAEKTEEDNYIVKAYKRKGKDQPDWFKFYRQTDIAVDYNAVASCLSIEDAQNVLAERLLALNGMDENGEKVESVDKRRLDTVSTVVSTVYSKGITGLPVWLEIANYINPKFIDLALQEVQQRDNAEKIMLHYPKLNVQDAPKAAEDNDNDEK